MEWWIAEAMDLIQQRAALLDDEHASDLADDLYRTWPDDSPTEAVAKFFRIAIPLGWKPATPSQRQVPLSS